MTKQFTPEHFLLCARLNQEHIDYRGEEGFPRAGEFASNGQQKGWYPDLLITGTPITIDIDGKVHEKLSAERNDQKKDEWLRAHGFRPLRFTNFDVKHRMDDVIRTIRIEMLKP